MRKTSLWRSKVQSLNLCSKCPPQLALFYSFVNIIPVKYIRTPSLILVLNSQRQSTLLYYSIAEEIVKENVIEIVMNAVKAKVVFEEIEREETAIVGIVVIVNVMKESDLIEIEVIVIQIEIEVIVIVIQIVKNIVMNRVSKKKKAK